MTEEYGKVYSTTNYDSFKCIEGNRTVKDGNVKKLIKSIEDKNLLEVNPIIVNKKMEVIDGQTRLAAARVLGLPIYYIVSQTGKLDDVILLNVNKSKWDSADYLDSFIAKKMPDYFVVKQFHEEYQIPITMCIVLLGGVKLGGNSTQTLRSEFKRGEFKVVSVERAKRIAEKLVDLRAFADRGIWRSRDFVMAVVMLDKTPSISHKALIRKFKNYDLSIYKQGSPADYFRRFEEVYAFEPKKD